MVKYFDLSPHNLQYVAKLGNMFVKHCKGLVSPFCKITSGAMISRVLCDWQKLLLRTTYDPPF